MYSTITDKIHFFITKNAHFWATMYNKMTIKEVYHTNIHHMLGDTPQY